MHSNLGAVDATSPNSTPKQSPLAENLTGAGCSGQFTLSYQLLPFSGRSLVSGLPQNRTSTPGWRRGSAISQAALACGVAVGAGSAKKDQFNQIFSSRHRGLAAGLVGRRQPGCS
jgi:hypothetical protein